jgi:hypothetical protein
MRFDQIRTWLPVRKAERRYSTQLLTALLETLFRISEVFSSVVQPAGAGGLERARLPPGLIPLRQPAQDLLPQDGPQLLPRLLPQVTSPHLMSSCLHRRN